MITVFPDAKKITQPKYYDIGVVLQQIKSCNLQKQIDTIRAEKDNKKKAALKRMLPCIIFAGEFKTREDSAIIKHAGFAILDFDKLENVCATKEEMKAYLFVYAAFISPSGDGLKVVVRIPPTIVKHKNYYYGLMKIFPFLDSTSQNISRVCFASADSDIYINTEAIEFTEEADEPKQHHKEAPIVAYNSAAHTNYSKAEIALNMIRNSIDDEKHIVLLKAAKLMGGFIAGGIVEEVEAVRLLENEISKKNIVDFDGAKKTISDGIKYGKVTPIQQIYEAIKIMPKSSGVKHADDVWEKMKHSFIHGKERGKTTHFKSFDENFTWKKGEITLVIGKGNSGKTEFVLQLMLLKSIFDGWRWGVFSPENYPQDEFYDGLIHSYIGKTTDPFYKNYQMTMDEYERGYKFIREHFFYVYPEEIHTIEEIESNFLYLIQEKNINGTFIDPHNQVVTPNQNKRDDQFLSEYLTQRKHFAVKHQLCDVISSHPKNMSKNKNGEYDVPDIYDIAGGAMWSNKADNIISVHRPNYIHDPKDTMVEIHIKKIKKQRLVGVPGMCMFDFKRTTNRYYLNGISPIDSEPIEKDLPVPKHYNINNFSESKKTDIDPF